MAPTFKPDDIELIPDGWERFERAVDAVSKSGPMHRYARGRTGAAVADAIISTGIIPESLLAYLGGARPRLPAQLKGDPIPPG